MNWMSSVFFKVCLFGFIGLACPTALLKAEGIIKGTVLDKNSGEPVIGAAVMLPLSAFVSESRKQHHGML